MSGHDESRWRQVLLEYITDIANGDSALSMADIDAEPNPALSEIIAGLLMLNEELEFREEERAAAERQRVEAERQRVEAERRSLELSTPVLELGRRVLLMPLVGVVDLGRSEQMVERALEAIASKGGRVLVIDVTGVASIDTRVASRLTATMRAVALLGARTILTGISPANARELVALDIDLGSVLTRRTLGEGLETAFAMN